MIKTSSMNLPSTMRGGIAGMLITLMVIAVVGGATYFAVSSMLGGDDAVAETSSEATQGMTKADAERIGREEGAKVARDIAYEAALDVAQSSGAAALYGDSYASAETTDYGSYGDDSDSGTTDSGDYGSSPGTADSGSYDSYGGGASSDGGASDTGSDDGSSSDDYSSDDYGSYDYGDSSSDSSTSGSNAGSSSSSSDSDDYASDDYGSDDYGSDDYSSDDYAADDYGSDDYDSTDTASSSSSSADSSSQAASETPVRSNPNEPEPKVTGKAPPPATAIAPWWPPAKDQSSGAMKVLYAGTFAGNDGKGIGVLFGEAVKSGQSFSDFIKVIDDKGATVDVDWALATNPALLKTGNLERGRYLVQLKPGLQSAKGRAQGLSLEGPIFID